MAITLTRSKSTAKASTTKKIQVAPKEKVTSSSRIQEAVKLDTQEALATELLTLTKELEELEYTAKLNRIKAIKEELISTVEPENNKEVKISVPDMGIVIISKPSTSTKVNSQEVYNAIGAKQFAKIATVGVTDAKKYLTPEQAEQCLTVETGSRSVKITTL